jgi:hypothetical protein
MIYRSDILKELRKILWVVQLNSCTYIYYVVRGGSGVSHCLNTLLGF